MQKEIKEVNLVSCLEASAPRTEQTETDKLGPLHVFILNGLCIEHLWFTFTEQTQSILYHGHIMSVKSTAKVPKATITGLRK